VTLYLEEQGPPNLTPYYEVSGPDLRPTIANVVRTIAEFRPSRSLGGPPRRCRPAGFKLRCGGLDATSFPSAELVAFVLSACRDAEVALKCTAGLHHPIRRFDAGVNATMHGFLNVFGAGVLAAARGLKEHHIVQILMDEDPTSFVLNDRGLCWKEDCATVAEIEKARETSVISFGSCSFDEPREDLRALGLLRAV
jgi:hypothetical protein